MQRINWKFLFRATLVAAIVIAIVWLTKVMWEAAVSNAPKAASISLIIVALLFGAAITLLADGAHTES